MKTDYKKVLNILAQDIQNEECSGVLPTNNTPEIKANNVTTNSHVPKTGNHNSTNTVQISLPSDPVEVNESTEVCGDESIWQEFS